IRDEGILGFTGAVGDDRVVAGLSRGVDRLDSLGQGTDLVNLDEDGVPYPAGDPLTETHRVRHEEVIADELNVIADGIGQGLPAVPVVLVEGVLDGPDREAAG